MSAYACYRNATGSGVPEYVPGFIAVRRQPPDLSHSTMWFWDARGRFPGGTIHHAAPAWLSSDRVPAQANFSPALRSSLPARGGLPCGSGLGQVFDVSLNVPAEDSRCRRPIVSTLKPGVEKSPGSIREAILATGMHTMFPR